jgi:FkbM family methyltransferase
MVEPIIDYFEKLKSNYSHIKNIQFENIAISDKEGTAEMRYIPRNQIVSGNVKFRLENEPNLLKEHWAGGLGSFYENKNNLGCPELKQFEKKVIVKTQTFDYLIEKYKVYDYKNVVIQTDCEGHDLVLLRNFPFDKVKPKIYITEIIDEISYPKSHPFYGTKLSLYTKEEYQEVIKLFTVNEYKLFKENDLVAVLNSSQVDTSQFPKSIKERLKSKFKNLKVKLKNIQNKITNKN